MWLIIRSFLAGRSVVNDCRTALRKLGCPHWDDQPRRTMTLPFRVTAAVGARNGQRTCLVLGLHTGHGLRALCTHLTPSTRSAQEDVDRDQFQEDCAEEDRIERKGTICRRYTPRTRDNRTQLRLGANHRGSPGIVHRSGTP